MVVEPSTLKVALHGAVAPAFSCITPAPTTPPCALAQIECEVDVNIDGKPVIDLSSVVAATSEVTAAVDKKFKETEAKINDLCTKVTAQCAALQEQIDQLAMQPQLQTMSDQLDALKDDPCFDESLLKVCFSGEFVRFTNLVSRPDLNGCLGEIIDYRKEQKRFSVRVLGQPWPIFVKPTSLAVRKDGMTSNPVFHQCPVCQRGEHEHIERYCSYCRASASERVSALRSRMPDCDYFTFYNDIQEHKRFSESCSLPYGM